MEADEAEEAEEAAEADGGVEVDSDHLAVEAAVAAAEAELDAEALWRKVAIARGRAERADVCGVEPAMEQARASLSEMLLAQEAHRADVERTRMAINELESHFADLRTAEGEASDVRSPTVEELERIADAIADEHFA